MIIGGVEQKAHCFVLDLPHSDGCFRQGLLTPIARWCGGPVPEPLPSPRLPSLCLQPDGLPRWGVGTRIIRRRKYLTTICHSSRNRSICLTLHHQPV